jgi:quercetin dioxygenase-like cupin family protein
VARPHGEVVHSVDVAPDAVPAGPFAGLERRLLSQDDETGASTALVSIPAGREIVLGGSDRPSELFVLSGEGELASRVIRAGTYAYVPSESPGGTLALAAEALVLVMAEAASRARGEVLVVDTEELRWEERSIAAVPPGLTIKRLRVDEETGERTWLAACVPGWCEDRAEIHPTVEEAFLIRGDTLLGERGEMSPGCYFWRPPLVRHGPMTTRDGCLVFFRTKGGGLEVEYEDVPGWSALVADYVARRPYFAAPA